MENLDLKHNERNVKQEPFSLCGVRRRNLQDWTERKEKVMGDGHDQSTLTARMNIE
jgi:hypothetical protein